jgi:diamine N-acetyltransferase
MLKGDKILLRALEITDLDAIYHWENDPATWDVSNTVNPFSRFFLEQYILNSQNNIFLDKQLRLIVQTQGNEAAGAVDLFDFDAHNRRCGIGILIAEKFRKKGYASQAIDIILDYGKETLNLNQMFCNINSDNNVSLRLFQNKGFEITGIKKQWNLRKNSWFDEYFLQRLF